jgi:hypothetical protein
MAMTFQGMIFLGDGLSGRWSFHLYSPQKEKPRFYRGFGGIFELVSIITLLTGSDPAPPPRMETNSG